MFKHCLRLKMKEM